MKLKYKKYSRLSKSQNKWNKRNSDKNFLNHHNYFQHKDLKVYFEKYIFYKMIKK